MRPVVRRASFVLHIAPTLDQPVFPGGLVNTLDSFLDAQSAILSVPNALWIDQYLTIRPEFFERVEAAAQSRRLLIGPWYAFSESSTSSAESLIRNLSLGLDTARALSGLKRLSIAVPWSGPIPWYVPQLLDEFGIKTLIIPRAEPPLEQRLTGPAEHTIYQCQALTLTDGQSLADLRAEAAPYCQSGHMLILTPPDVSGELPAAPVTDILAFSHAGAYAREIESAAALQSWPDAALSLSSDFQADHPLLAVERAAVQHTADDARWFPRPQTWLRSLWQAQFSGAPQAQPDFSAPLSALVDATPPFVISALKPADKTESCIIRGWNAGPEPIAVTLRLWRRFERADVLRADETPTGGTLGIDADGCLRFRAVPGRILTFGLH